jgi:hypothetical protein
MPASALPRVSRSHGKPDMRFLICDNLSRISDNG